MSAHTAQPTMDRHSQLDHGATLADSLGYPFLKAVPALVLALCFPISNVVCVLAPFFAQIRHVQNNQLLAATSSLG